MVVWLSATAGKAAEEPIPAVVDVLSEEDGADPREAQGSQETTERPLPRREAEEAKLAELNERMKKWFKMF